MTADYIDSSYCWQAVAFVPVMSLKGSFWSQEKNAHWIWDPMGNDVANDSDRRQTLTNHPSGWQEHRWNCLQLPLTESSSRRLPVPLFFVACVVYFYL